MTKNQKQILIVLGVLLGAGGISFFYWRSIPRRLDIKLNPQNRKAIEEAELE